jgi:hypothetical protein
LSACRPLTHYLSQSTPEKGQIVSDHTGYHDGGHANQADGISVRSSRIHTQVSVHNGLVDAVYNKVRYISLFQRAL